MAFNPEKQFVDGQNPFDDRPQTNEPLVGDSSDGLELVNTPDHSFEAFVEDFKSAYKNEPDLHLLKINTDDLGQDDADIWFKFRESQAGNFTLTPGMLEDYKKDVFKSGNSSRNNLAGFISNKILVLWIQKGMIWEKSVGPDAKTDQ